MTRTMFVTGVLSSKAEEEAGKTSIAADLGREVVRCGQMLQHSPRAVLCKDNR